MTTQAERRPLHQSSRSAGATILLILAAIVGLGAICLADDSPKPDPAGIATGDKTSVVDAAGNPLVPITSCCSCRRGLPCSRADWYARKMPRI